MEIINQVEKGQKATEGIAILIEAREEDRSERSKGYRRNYTPERRNTQEREEDRLERSKGHRRN